MVCNFIRHIERAETIVRIEYHEIPHSDSFCYICSIISNDREIMKMSNIG